MNERYTRTALALHWLMAALLIGMVSLGLYMHELPLSPRKLQLYSYHKWAGVTAFVLVLVRLAWRATHRPPPLPPGTSATVRRAASAGHALLYLLMIAIPLSGWLMSSAKGFQTVWFGVLPIPDLLGKDAALGDTLRAVHESLNWTLIVVALGHVLAALKHQFIDKDGLLARMWPQRTRAASHASNTEQ
ncbi:MAG: cytochrome b [Steroidobacteraceae bacterium]|nr:cytochrome b [Steroidobacteraceae bacterium]